MTDKYPMCDKLYAVSADSQKIGEFVEWLHAQGITLARFEDGKTWPHPITEARGK